ncbi:hypothetical protein [Actinomycetospora termitidis]|uniref:Protein kinase domain-containing protein n=1 Tax=Actinomycetospora termitidis TaxID=3053470 RepID=A0ABT7MFT5_9PSEU|nr:hypothetical protein [Actinomycetospora sp. Odt1-22]MDL5159014.1 hypothetical protein [Actinomycetospora sp. Odt1-22]
MSIDAGRVLGNRYRLDRKLAGTADRPVWLARDEWSDEDEDVLLALVPDSAGPGAEAAATRRVVGREVRTAIGLRSPHLRRVLDVIADDSGLWVAARTRPGSRTLHEILAEPGTPTPTRLARWGRDAAAGLADLHEAGLEHRNIRSALIAIDDDGSASLLGVAATGDLSSATTGDPADPGDDDFGDEDALGTDDVRAIGALLREAVAPTGPDAAPSDEHDVRHLEALTAVMNLAADGEISAGELRRRLSDVLESQPTSLPVANPPSATEARTVRVDPHESLPEGEDETTKRTAPAPPAAYVGPPWSAGRPAQQGPPPGMGQPPRWPGPSPDHLPVASLPGGPVAPTEERSTDERTGGERTTRTPRTRGRDWVAGHRGLVAAAAIVVALLLVGGLLVAGIGGTGPRRADAIAAPGAGTPTNPPAPASVAPPSAVGDRRTANPCSLLSTGSFAGFGTPTLFEDFGPFGSCAVLTATAQGGSYLTSVGFYTAGEFVRTTPTEQVGDVAVTRLPASTADRCRRLLALPDGLIVEVETRAVTAASGVDPCALADAGTSTAIPVLVGRSTARRPLDPALQLGSLDACGLLESAALAQVPGLDPTRRVPWFEGWGCSVGYNFALTNAPYANLSFDRTSPLPGTPTRIGRHSAVVTPTPASDGRSASCRVTFIQRSYIGSSGRARAEIAQLTVFGASGDPCSTATPVAAATEARLPAPA